MSVACACVAVLAGCGSGGAPSNRDAASKSKPPSTSKPTTAAPTTASDSTPTPPDEFGSIPKGFERLSDSGEKDLPPGIVDSFVRTGDCCKGQENVRGNGRASYPPTILIRRYAVDATIAEVAAEGVNAIQKDSRLVPGSVVSKTAAGWAVTEFRIKVGTDLPQLQSTAFDRVRGGMLEEFAYVDAVVDHAGNAAEIVAFRDQIDWDRVERVQPE